MSWILYILALPAIFFLYHFGKGVMMGIRLGLPVVFRIVNADKDAIGSNTNSENEDESEAPTFKVINK
jgi:hypothetical protein